MPLVAFHQLSPADSNHWEQKLPRSCKITAVIKKSCVRARPFSLRGTNLSEMIEPLRKAAASSGVNARDHGFTLLEVLVAFAIISMALVPLLQGGSESLRGVDVAGQTETAVALAQSHLRLFEELVKPGAQERQGDDGPYHWRLRIVPLDSVPASALGGKRQDPTVLYQVLATVSWASQGRQSSIRLVTKRLSPVPPMLP